MVNLIGVEISQRFGGFFHHSFHFFFFWGGDVLLLSIVIIVPCSFGFCSKSARKGVWYMV